MEHLTVQTAGAAFHVARVGGGKPLVLLHGWPEFWATWEPVMQRLQDRFTLIAPDALKNYGDDAYLEIRLWTNRGKEVARESLYEIEVPEVEAEEPAPTEK